MEKQRSKSSVRRFFELPSRTQYVLANEPKPGTVHTEVFAMLSQVFGTETFSEHDAVWYIANFPKQVPYSDAEKTFRNMIVKGHVTEVSRSAP